MRRGARILLVVLSVSGLLAALLPVNPAGASHNADEHSANMTLEATSPKTGVVNSDAAFWGNRMYSGYFGGFRILDITDPTDPVQITDFTCNGSQNDISIWNNDPDPEADLLFLSVDGPRTDETCASGATTASNPDSWEGVRIFDINNELAPVQIAQVPTDCGSHTHTLIPDPDPAAPDYLFLYVSSYPLGAAAVTTSIAARDNPTPGPDFPAGVRNNGTDCLEPEAGEAEPNGVHSKISIIRVDLADPAAADDRVPGPDPDGPGPLDPVGWTYPAVKESPLDGSTRWVNRSTPDRSFDFAGCHDIAVFTALDLAASACWVEAQMWDISDPWSPFFLRRERNDEIDTLFHSAAFTWDGKIVAFGDEAGGGGAPRCIDPDDEQGRIWFYTKSLRLLGSYKIPRPQPRPQICTAHIFDFLPVTDGTYTMVSSWYFGGTSVVDVNDPANAREIGYYEAHTPVPGGVDPVDSETWASYWYNGYIYANDIPRGVDVFSFSDPRTATAQTFAYHNPQTQENLIAQTYTFGSTVTIRHRLRPHVFKGRVGSESASCEADRDVRVRKVRPGPDRLIGTDTTDANGRWVIPHTVGGAGRYYAVVAATSFPDGINTVVCQRDRSGTIGVRR